MVAQFTGNPMGQTDLEAGAVEDTFMNQVREHRLVLGGNGGLCPQLFPDGIFSRGTWVGVEHYGIHTGFQYLDIRVGGKTFASFYRSINLD
jgi:hypothetical protein